MAEKDINNLKKELFNLKIMKKSGQLTDTSQFKKLKKQIALQLTKERLNKDA
jgi:ribosomal protein L29